MCTHVSSNVQIQRGMALTPVARHRKASPRSGVNKSHLATGWAGSRDLSPIWELPKVRGPDIDSS